MFITHIQSPFCLGLVVPLIPTTLSSGVCPVSTCANCSVFKTHFARIVTNSNKYTLASPILKRLHWLPVEFRCIFKTATLVYKFLHSGHPSYFGSFLSTHCGRYGCLLKGSWKSLNPIPLYIYSKNTLTTALLLMSPRFGMIYHLPVRTQLLKRLLSVLEFIQVVAAFF